MISSRETLEDHSCGGTARREGKGIASVLERGYGGLEVGAVRVGRTRVLVLTDRLADGGLCEGGRERDGLNDSASDWIMRRAGVDGQSTEALGGGRRPRRSGNRVVRSGHCGRHDR